MSKEEQGKPKKTIGEVLAQKEPMGDAERLVVASVINKIVDIAKHKKGNDFDIALHNLFVAPHENGHDYTEDMIGASLLAISAVRDSGRFNAREIQSLERIEDWFRNS
jgi:hypothetical protein